MNERIYCAMGRGSACGRPRERDARDAGGRHGSLSRAAIFSIALLLASTANLALAGRVPLWEVGVGGGLLTLPDYRGSDRSKVYPYPFLLAYLRGRILQADERGIRGLFFESDRFKLDVSLDGSVPVSSSDNPAREGMSDLAPSFQVGPMLRFLLWEGSSAEGQSLSLDLPVRAAFAIDGGLKHLGYTAYPHLSYRRTVQIGAQDWHLNLSGGPLWGSDGYHRYFYSVSPAEATPNRPSYDAEGGYSGMRVMFTAYHRTPEWLVSVYGVYDSVQGAVFSDSPLVTQDSGVTVGFLATWFLFRSDRTVETNGRDW